MEYNACTYVESEWLWCATEVAEDGDMVPNRYIISVNVLESFISPDDCQCKCFLFVDMVIVILWNGPMVVETFHVHSQRYKNCPLSLKKIITDEDRFNSSPSATKTLTISSNFLV